jgi:saccharopine dehydrogenase-like NADP-dependent oxidoreductase
MGSAIAYDMIKCKDVSEVMVADLDEKKLNEFVNKMQGGKLSMKKSRKQLRLSFRAD